MKNRQIHYINQIVVISLIILSCTSCGTKSSPTAEKPVSQPLAERAMFSGIGNLDIFDPSVTRDPGPGRLWMSYSSVDTSIYFNPATYWAVSIRLAFSDDNGVSW